MKLCFPEKVLLQHLIALGKTGAGKSSALRHKKRVCIVDIKGDWWGLKSSADGKSAGFPVVAFGDFREPKAQDVPINAQSGKQVAELIASGNRPCIIGFRGWMPGQVTDFWIDFASTLFNKNEGELFVVISECHNYAPKGKVLDPKAGKVLHWTNRLLSEGRGLGMTFLLDSQRPQKVHNDTLTSCETLIAMRVTHAADRNALKDWIDGCGDKATGTEVLNTVAGMARGEGWVWSPEIGFGPQRIQFPMFETFDSFAPAQLQNKVSDSGWSTVDLEVVKSKLAKVIEEAKENDPAALKARIRQLERDMGKMPVGQSTIVEKVVEPQAIHAAVKELIIKGELYTAAAIKEALRLKDDLWTKAVGEYSEGIKAAIGTVRFAKPQPIALEEISNAGVPPAFRSFQVAKTAPRTIPGPATRANGHGANAGTGDSEFSGGARKLLSALLAYPEGISRGQAKILCGFAERTLTNYVSELNVAGVLAKDGRLLRVQPESANEMRAIAGELKPPRDTEEVLSLWKPRLTGGAVKLLDVLAGSRGHGLDRQSVMEITGFAERTLTNYVSELSVAGLLTKPGQGELAANKQALFL